jgi:hypothetical protein
VRPSRFINFTAELLAAAEHPEIASIEPFDDPGTWLKPCGLRITLTSGQTFYLKMTRTSGDAGDDFTQPEHIPEPTFKIAKEELWQAGALGAGRS